MGGFRRLFLIYQYAALPSHGLMIQSRNAAGAFRQNRPVAATGAVRRCQPPTMTWRFALETVHSREKSVTNTKQASNMHVRQSSYSYEELLAAGRGEVFGRGNAQLPLP